MIWIRYLVSGLLAGVTLFVIFFLLSRASTPEREEMLLVRPLELLLPSDGGAPPEAPPQELQERPRPEPPARPGASP